MNDNALIMVFIRVSGSGICGLCGLFGFLCLSHEVRNYENSI